MTIASSMKDHAARLGVKPGRLFVDGKWTGGRGDARIDQVHPATNEVVTSLVIAGEQDVDDAVRAARRAFDETDWPHLPARDRRLIMRRFIDLVAKHTDQLTELQVLDNSNPISIQKMNYIVNGQSAVEVFEHATGWIDKLYGQTIPTYAAGFAGTTMTVRDPVGVVAAIAPWNAPLFLLCQKIAPALAAGCTVVMKPSEHTSLTALRIAELMEEADMPPGVVNLVTGPGNPTGEALINHPGVDKVTFTGSRAVGERIMRAAAGTFKRVSLELGGKSPLILFPDAHSPATSAAMAMSMISFGMSGQTCAATTRMIVHESLVDEAVGAALSVLPKVCQGNPFDPAITSAPIISRRQLDRIQGLVDRALDDGASLHGGGTVTFEDPAKGNFFRPTVLTNIRNDSEIAREEVFGPVMSVIPFADEDEAIRIANDNPYGLAAAIATGDNARAMRVARRIRAGTVNINAATLSPNMPFGGFKASGIGREGGEEGIGAFLETKTINFG